MGRKSSAKAHTPPPTKPPQAAKGSSMPLVAGVLALALIGGGFMYVRNARLQSDPAPAPDAAQAASIPTGLKPHPQANLPPLQFPAYQMPRSPEVVTAAYKFAAEHPEVLSYVPCFCGCERSGHRGNEDCFVKARDINGDVVLWDDHGMECAVCLDVATRARLMHAAGASVREIRTAIDKEWGSKSTNHTHTPEPPSQ